MLHALLAMNLRRKASVSCAMTKRATRSPLPCARWAAQEKMGQRHAVARLMSNPEREAFEQRIARFKPTPRNIATAARFTKADREKYGQARSRVGNKTKRPMQALLQLPLIDGDLEAERRKDRNAARRTRRQDGTPQWSPSVPASLRHRQCDRAYQQAKRRAKGATPREDTSIEALRPWEADGISRRTWWRRQDLAQIRRLQDGTNSSTAGLPPKPLKHRHYPVKADGPEPKKVREAKGPSPRAICAVRPQGSSRWNPRRQPGSIRQARRNRQCARSG